MLKLKINFYSVPGEGGRPTMDETRPCELQTLAEGHTCRVERCAHGTIHVSVGGVTLRLQPAHCYDLTRTLRAASARLGAPARLPARALC
jgi:hypothetical protein